MHNGFFLVLLLTRAGCGSEPGAAGPVSTASIGIELEVGTGLKWDSELAASGWVSDIVVSIDEVSANAGAAAGAGIGDRIGAVSVTIDVMADLIIGAMVVAAAVIGAVADATIGTDVDAGMT